jgi:hypothetical protein
MIGGLSQPHRLPSHVSTHAVRLDRDRRVLHGVALVADRMVDLVADQRVDPAADLETNNEVALDQHLRTVDVHDVRKRNVVTPLSESADTRAS